VEFAEAFRADTKITRLAKALDHDEAIDGVPAREALAKAVGPHLHDVVDEAGGVDRVERVGFPAFLGDQEGDAVRAELADRLGADVFEIPMGPPSPRGSGWRTDCTTRSTTRASGSRPGIRSSASRPRRTARSRRVAVDRKGRDALRRRRLRTRDRRARREGLDSNREGVREPVFGLHVEQPADRYEWFVDDAFGDQPYARFGVRIDEDGRVLDADGVGVRERLRGRQGRRRRGRGKGRSPRAGCRSRPGLWRGGRQRRQPNDTTHGRRRGRRRGERDERDERGGRPRQPGSPSPGVPEAGRDEQPSIFVPDDGEPKETAATDGGASRARPAGATRPNSIRTRTTPVDVFPGGDLDLREGADSCYKCTSCDTSCPVAEVDEEFPGPKFQGPEQWRLKRKGGPRHRRVDHLLFELHAL